ncbi:unnamed protein product [Agarophyton chilense]|eukprot:gb/GEZJ01000053.1/.p4 GENE.gb/GEZJ01000053.1/~~gb/GEZJ01000053.1/.p4  ORF type:complete len:360 (-),score=85.22 gb/GEZJ01000053.1/:2679-3758(-)
MAGIKHATKKKFARSTTRKKTIHSGISSEYTTLRGQLTSISSSVKTLMKGFNTARESWLAVAKEEKSFTETLAAAFPDDGPVKSHVKEVESAVHQMQQKMLANEGPDTPHSKIVAVLEGYLKLIDDLETDCADVETSYTEVSRYQKKVDKLQKKPGKRQKQLQRNLEKLSVARGAHQTKLDDIVKRLKTAQEKHQVVFQCAHHAYWIAQDRYFTTVEKITQSVRWESVSVQERITDIDIHATEKLEPLLRAVALLPPVTASDITTPPAIQPPSPTKHQDEVIPSPEKEKETKEEKDEDGERKTGKVGADDSKAEAETSKRASSKAGESKDKAKKLPETPLSTPRKAVESEPVTPEVKAL